jgi:nitrite reductase/ring-hydroxylating ferredoxin subunit
MQPQPVPFQVVDPERIPVKRYYDEEFYKLECDRLWPHVWQMACRLEQIPNVGDWVEYSNLGKSVIIVRTKHGIKAYHNTCRHRGVQLVRDHGNCEKMGFICPFHGWRWNMDGESTFVYGKQLFSERQLDHADLALVPVRVELWAGCAFINLDNDAPPLREYIGPLAERLDRYQVDKLRAEWWYATVLPSNWKIAMEAFMEGYHVMATHPQLQAAAPPLYSARYGADTGGLGKSMNPNPTARESIGEQFRNMELVSAGMAGMCHAKDLATARSMLDVALPDDPAQAVTTWYGMVGAEVTKQGRARGEPTPDINAVAVSHPVEAVEFIFPHFFLLPFLSSFASYRIRPLGPESCLFEIWSLTLFPEGKAPPPPMEPVTLPYNSDEFPQIPRQDYSNIPRQQIGLHGGGFEFMRLGKDIEGLISNYHRVIDGYLRRDSSERLKKATAAIGSGFDRPIKDLGL